jgi:putative ABC transport system substrate-binding protein
MKHMKIALSILLIATFVFAGAVQAQDDGHQTVGIVMISTRLEPTIEFFLAELAERGYIEGDIDEVWAELLEARIIEQEAITVIFPPPIGEDLESLPEVIQSVIDAGVDVILASSRPEAVAIRAITDEIPVVFMLGADPVGAGLVESLTEPGGNVTGITASRYQGRSLQFLLEIDPSIERVYHAYRPDDLLGVFALEAMQEVAVSLDVEIVTHEFSDVDGLLQAIREIPEDIDAIVLSSDQQNYEPQVLMGWIGAANRLHVGMAVFAVAEAPGLLVGYGPDFNGNAVLAAGMVDEILQGADPADMPVLNSEYALMVNLGVAQSLGIDIPRAVLRQADVIIRPAAEEMEAEATPEATEETDGASDD